MPKKVKLIVAALVIIAVLATGCSRQATTPQPTPPTDVTYVPFEDEALGLSLEYPDDWIAHSAFSGLTLASSQSVIDSDSLANIEDEAFVNLIPGELAVFGMQSGQEFSSDQPQEVLDVYRGLLENEGQSFTVRRPPEVRTVNGQNVAQMTVESDVDGEQLVTIFSVIINDEFMVLASAGALQGHFDEVQPILAHVLDSIVVSPPAGIES
ncbi:MAG TPA: hypothetical protein VE553_06595 [Candidatus Binatia bacterium]|jgi:hypothetical protein|nr:hypothetical protein [Candidatus Binatia bacterium]